MGAVKTAMTPTAPHAQPTVRLKRCFECGQVREVPRATAIRAVLHCGRCRQQTIHGPARLSPGEVTRLLLQAEFTEEWPDLNLRRLRALRFTQSLSFSDRGWPATASTPLTVTK